VAESGGGLQLTVPVGALRKQRVSVTVAADAQGRSTVTIASVCGPATGQNAISLLRYNSELLHGAFAIRTVGGVDTVVLQAAFPADSLNALQAGAILASIAWQADKAEEQLGGRDEN